MSRAVGWTIAQRRQAERAPVLLREDDSGLMPVLLAAALMAFALLLAAAWLLGATPDA